MAKMKDVADKAGVSVATVSHVFTGKRYVSPEVKDRVLKAVEELDYHINLNARSLKTSRTKTIGVVLPDITKLFFSEVLRGILDTVEQHGYKITVLSSYFDFSKEKECISSLRSNNVDGIILDSCCDYHDLKSWARELATYESRYTPVVFIETAPDDSFVSSVTIDAYYWSYKVTQYLVSLGKKKILYVSGPLHLRQERDRLSGYKQALKDSGIKYNENLVISSDFSSSSSYDAIKVLTPKGSLKFDAVQCSNDEAAVGALRVLKEQGYKVPEEIAVTGFDNLFPSTLISPAITTVNVPRHEIGIEAANECIHHIDDPTLPNRTIVLSADIVKRASTEESLETAWELHSW